MKRRDREAYLSAEEPSAQLWSAGNGKGVLSLIFNGFSCV